MNFRSKCGQFSLSATMATMLISSFSYAGTAQIRQDLVEIKATLIDAKVDLNCTSQTPELCHSRQDILVPDQTRLNFKNDMASMAPGQEFRKQRIDEINALKEANKKMTGNGQELQISENQDRIRMLEEEDRPEYANFNLLRFLWKSNIVFYRPDGYNDSEAINMIALDHTMVTFDKTKSGRTMRIEEVGGHLNGLYASKDVRISINYSPEMRNSFVLKVDRFGKRPGEQLKTQYASESMIARCEERTIYNTIAGFKTTVDEKHLLCKLPEDRGFLRFRILN